MFHCSVLRFPLRDSLHSPGEMFLFFLCSSPNQFDVALAFWVFCLGKLPTGINRYKKTCLCSSARDGHAASLHPWWLRGRPHSSFHQFRIFPPSHAVNAVTLSGFHTGFHTATTPHGRFIMFHHFTISPFHHIPVVFTSWGKARLFAIEWRSLPVPTSAELCQDVEVSRSRDVSSFQQAIAHESSKPNHRATCGKVWSIGQFWWILRSKYPHILGRLVQNPETFWLRWLRWLRWLC